MKKKQFYFCFEDKKTSYELITFGKVRNNGPRASMIIKTKQLDTIPTIYKQKTDIQLRMYFFN